MTNKQISLEKHNLSLWSFRHQLTVIDYCSNSYISGGKNLEVGLEIPLFPCSPRWPGLIWGGKAMCRDSREGTLAVTLLIRLHQYDSLPLVWASRSLDWARSCQLFPVCMLSLPFQAELIPPVPENTFSQILSIFQGLSCGLLPPWESVPSA